MRVRLMPHVPDDLIFRQFKHAVQCNGKFHYAEIGRQMAS